MNIKKNIGDESNLVPLQGLGVSSPFRGLEAYIFIA
jgi:hypothetical protein